MGNTPVKAVVFYEDLSAEEQRRVNRNIREFIEDYTQSHTSIDMVSLLDSIHPVSYITFRKRMTLVRLLRSFSPVPFTLVEHSCSRNYSVVFVQMPERRTLTSSIPMI